MTRATLGDRKLQCVAVAVFPSMFSFLCYVQWSTEGNWDSECTVSPMAGTDQWSCKCEQRRAQLDNKWTQELSTKHRVGFRRPRRNSVYPLMGFWLPSVSKKHIGLPVNSWVLYVGYCPHGVWEEVKWSIVSYDIVIYLYKNKLRDRNSCEEKTL